jgi:hypothetical protein
MSRVNCGMKIALADPSRLESLLAYLRDNGCIAYTDEAPWTVTALPHDGMDKRALIGVIARWTAAERARLAVDD